MAWRVARSLQVLTAEVRVLHPGTTVWTIGDPAHQASASDHNPNAQAVVCASDTLGDRGLDLGWYAARVVASRHRALKYVIYNRRIWSKARAAEGWRPYGGPNPHTGHVHVSVGVGPDGRSTGPYDDTSTWGLTKEDDVSAEDVWGYDPGRATKGAIKNPPWRHDHESNPTVQPAFALSDSWNRVHALQDRLAEVAATLEVLAGRDVATAVRAELDRAAETERAERQAELAELHARLGGLAAVLVAELGPALAAELGEAAGELDAAVVEAAVARALARVSLTVAPAEPA